MKHINYILGAFISMATVSVSCVDDSKLLFSAEKPVSIEQMEYLNDYDALKSYVDRTANPGFKLGAGITASDYAKKGMIYHLANSNFDEVTAGNAMKYASCVKDDGSMDFSQVASFVSAAKEAGTTIYGHTLAWHAQQQNGYLNGLIAPVIIPGAPSGKCLHVHQDVAANGWDGQLYYTMSSGAILTTGTEYTLTFRGKASAMFDLEIWLMNMASADQTVSTISIGTEWNNYSCTFTPKNDNTNAIKVIVGRLAGDFYMDDLKLTASGSNVNLINNAGFEEDDMSNWQKYSWHKFTYSIEAISGDGGNLGYCMNLTNASKKANSWDAQVWYQFTSPLVKGVEYTFTCMTKADSEYNTSIFLQKSVGDGQGYPGGFAIPTKWTAVKLVFSPSEDGFDKFTINFGDFAGVISIDDAKLTASGSQDNLIVNGDFEAGGLDGWKSWNGYQTLSGKGEGYSSGELIVEKTPEEKKEILTNALDRWIKGMMEACDGYVKSWDVVNEPMSDGNTSELKYTSNVSADEAKNNFYWQDYLGKDYARIAIKLARQYGGDGLKLFINDYNLEAAYNSNAKCEGLINMVKYWESDGVTKIDGIGTQMHVTYALKPETQQKNEEAVVKMFQLLAASGKLIKISELDMGISDETGKSILTTNVTQEQHKAMSDYYKFILKKYFELIPAAQRYGITQWAATDSPADSGWRKGEPIGLWDLNYNRKHTYAGFADGLTGK